MDSNGEGRQHARTGGECKSETETPRKNTKAVLKVQNCNGDEECF